jgi:hypothetical protein
VENRNCRDSSDAIAAQLGKLIAGSTVYIHEAVHVTDTETLNT